MNGCICYTVYETSVLSHINSIERETQHGKCSTWGDDDPISQVPEKNPI